MLGVTHHHYPMEGLIILFVLAIFVAPIILSIVALVKVYSLQSKIDTLKASLTSEKGFAPAIPSESKGEGGEPSPAPPEPTAVKAFEREKKSAASSGENRPMQVATKNVEVTEPAKARKASSSPSHKPGINLEIFMGVKGAAFIGITILVIGISLLITYAIQNAWLGPGARSLLGVVSGAVLIGVGYFAEQKSQKYKLLTRVLTGGGGALFFVSVYAAYGMYHLIPAVTAGLGLLACAAAVFSLAMVYRSQAVAILGVIGAFLVPILIGEGVGNPTFLLIYVALLNVPVILLGLKRKWQWLYNLGFLSTALYYLQWSDLTHGKSLWLGLGFSLFFFLQYAGLGLLKLWKESEVKGREFDTLRLLMGSLLLLAAVYSLLENNPAGKWMGFWFLGYAMVHVGLAAFGFRRFPHFTHEILAFLAGATLFATLALPAQLDGAWVSVGWALEGVIVAWMAAKARSSFFQLLAFILGIIGILKGLVFDCTLYSATPDPFLNLRFWIGLVSAGLFAFQGWIVGSKAGEMKSNGWHELFWWIAILAVMGVGYPMRFGLSERMRLKAGSSYPGFF